MIKLFEFDRDLKELIAIDKKSQENPWTKTEFKKKLSQKSISCTIFENNNEILGFIVYEIFLRRITILRIGVHHLSRRKGIGKALIESLLKKLTNKCTLISAEVRETNLPIQLFLRSQAFRAVKILNNYYQDTNEDSYVFHRKHNP